jgi:hypothetical protein
MVVVVAVVVAVVVVRATQCVGAWMAVCALLWMDTALAMVRVTQCVGIHFWWQCAAVEDDAVIVKCCRMDGRVTVLAVAVKR